MYADTLRPNFTGGLYGKSVEQCKKKRTGNESRAGSSLKEAEILTEAHLGSRRICNGYNSARRGKSEVSGELVIMNWEPAELGDRLREDIAYICYRQKR